jgi:transcriptional regulator with XRE-family HTH domain
MVLIGERLKSLRGSQSMTQEQLAEVLNVSPQAVSRWENNTTYPDINLLPTMAMYFNVSVDYLLGMDEIQSAEEMVDIYTQVHHHVNTGDISKAIKILRDALRTYPKDYGFMSELALALSLYQHYQVNQLDLEEAIKLSEVILENCVNEKVRSTTKANLCFAYLKAGDANKAKALAGKLAHVWESRELLVPEMNEDGIDSVKLAQGIRTIINVMYAKVKMISETEWTDTSKMLMLGPDAFETVSVAEKMNLIKKFAQSN